MVNPFYGPSHQVPMDYGPIWIARYRVNTGNWVQEKGDYCSFDW
jgi:hypothetical protein